MILLLLKFCRCNWIGVSLFAMLFSFTWQFRAPQPFKCAPKSQFPITGYWDEQRIEENHRTAFANQLGRTDVEGCCWWGRGVLRGVTRGRCFFGQLNYHIGARAAREGRPSLYPIVDFCELVSFLLVCYLHRMIVS